MLAEIARIDWTRPWYDAVRPAFQRLCGEPVIGCPTAGAPASDASGAGNDGFIGAFNAGAARLGLVNHAGLPLRFVPQAALPPGTAYEAHIGATGCVPTRDNLHDFLNGLVWHTFPLVKRELNALQAAQIAAAGVGRARGPARDAATLFDENAALLVVRDDARGRALAEDLRAHRWREVLYTRRAAFARDAALWLFGHALMEKLAAPRKAITAHVRVVPAPDAWFALAHEGRRAWLDAYVAEALAAEGLDKSGFTPLPVLGVPGWWPGQDGDFYVDQSVFRPPRTQAGAAHHHKEQA